MAAVVLLFVCGWISIVTAQPNIMVSLSPQEHQTVCPGESISYNCAGNGTGITLFSPPIVSESNPLVVISGDAQRCRTGTNSAAAITLVDFSESSLFMVTFTLHISDQQSEEQRTVFCSVSSVDGMGAANTTFSVLGAPTAVTSLNFQEIASLSEDMAQVPVNISWNSPESAEEFMLQIMNTSYSTTIRSLESSVTVFLPYGTYSATLCTINRCGNICQDYPNIFSAEPQQSLKDNSSVVIALAVVVGILGLLLIVASIYGVATTVIIYKKSKN